MTSVKVVTLTATPACFIVCPNLSVIEAGAEVDSAIILKGLFKYYVIYLKDILDQWASAEIYYAIAIINVLSSPFLAVLSLDFRLWVF